MLAKKFKDVKLRKLFYKAELKKKIQKFLFINMNSRNKKYIFLINKPFSRVSKVNLVNRCVFTNRNKVSVKSYSISRLYLRELFQFGIVPGIFKAVW
jgi:ribosomal protein S14